MVDKKLQHERRPATEIDSVPYDQVHPVFRAYGPDQSNPALTMNGVLRNLMATHTPEDPIHVLANSALRGNWDALPELDRGVMQTSHEFARPINRGEYTTLGTDLLGLYHHLKHGEPDRGRSYVFPPLFDHEDPHEVAFAKHWISTHPKEGHGENGNRDLAPEPLAVHADYLEEKDPARAILVRRAIRHYWPEFADQHKLA